MRILAPVLMTVFCVSVFLTASQLNLVHLLYGLPAVAVSIALYGILDGRRKTKQNQTPRE